MKLTIKQTTYVPGHPQFEAGTTCEVEETIAQLLLERGAAEVQEKPAPTPAAHKEAKSENKQSKKS